MKHYHRYIYLFGIALVIASLPLSKATVGMGEVILFINWVMEGRLKNKFLVFFKNKTALILSSLFLLHLIGLTYTTDFNYAFFDLTVKLPLLALPLIISTAEPIGIKGLHRLLLLFIAAIVASTIASMINYFTMDFTDIRAICTFISHIRLSLMICLSIFILMYFVFNRNVVGTQNFLFLRFVFIIIACWLAFFLVILESITGLSILFITAFLLALVAAFRMKNKIYKTAIIALMIIIPSAVILYVGNIYKEYIANNTNTNNVLRKLTALGNPYMHDTLNTEMENGNYVYWNICRNEMEKAWNKRSSYKYDGKDRKGQGLKFTLMRFLTSKGYNKDADGVSKLIDDEVHSIENGIANVNYKRNQSLRTRIYETIWEYENVKTNANPNGFSAMQRLEYWKASICIISNHLLFGVGTGDMNIAFSKQYDIMKSPLDKNHRLRSHNQFLSFSCGFGLFGLLWFLITLIYPFFIKWVRKDFLYIVFFIVVVLSMFAEDTLETQIGLTFFAFFNTFLLLGRKPVSDSSGT